MEYKNHMKIYMLVLFVSVILTFVYLRWFPTIEFSLNDTKIVEVDGEEIIFITDYNFYYFPFKYVLQRENGEKLYNCAGLQEDVKKNLNVDGVPSNGCYLYPPHFAVFLSMFALFDFELSEKLWNYTLLFLFFFGVWLFAKVIFKNDKLNKKNYSMYILIFIGVALMNNSLEYDFYISNTNRLVFFLFSLIFYFHYYKKKSFIAGLILGLSIMFRITPAILFVFYLIKKEWSIVKGTLVGITLSTLLTLQMVDFTVVWNFFTKYFWGFSKMLTERFQLPINSSIQGFFLTYFPNLPINLFFMIYVLIMFSIFLYLLLKKKNETQEIILMSISPLVFTPHLEVTHMILMIFVHMIFIKYMAEHLYQVYKYKIIIYISIIINIFLLTIQPIKFETFIGMLMIVPLLFLIDFKNKKNRKINCFK